MDYQSFEYNPSSDTFDIGLSFTLDKVDCRFFQVEFFEENELIMNEFAKAHSTMNFSSPKIQIPYDLLGNTTYFRVTAIDFDNNMCSDDLSKQSFYHFLRRGIKISFARFISHSKCEVAKALTPHLKLV